VAFLSFEFEAEFACWTRLPLSCCALALVASWLGAVPLGWVLLFLFNLLGVVLWFVTTDVSPLAIVVGPFECRPLDTLPRLLVFWDDEGFISFNLDLSLPLGYTCGVHWGSEAEGGLGFEPCWYWNCNSWYQFIVFNFKPWAWTANKFANLHFSSTLFSREKTIWHRKVCSWMFFQQSSSWIELWLDAGTWFLVLRNSDPKFLTLQVKMFLISFHVD